VLIDQHADADTRHVEPVKEVLDAVLYLVIYFMGFLKFQHTLRHSLHDICVAVPYLYQRLTEPETIHHILFSRAWQDNHLQCAQCVWPAVRRLEDAENDLWEPKVKKWRYILYFWTTWR
jgi:hypothetical protein